MNRRSFLKMIGAFVGAPAIVALGRQEGPRGLKVTDMLRRNAALAKSSPRPLMVEGKKYYVVLAHPLWLKAICR